MAPVEKNNAKTDSAPAKQKRRIQPNVDKMASLFVASYNKRRPATSDLGNTKMGKVDVAELAQARRFEWVGEPIAEERVDDTVRQYFGAVLLDGVQHAIGDGVKVIDRHGVERMAVLSKLYHKLSPTPSGGPRAHVEYLFEHQYGWPGELLVHVPSTDAFHHRLTGCSTCDSPKIGPAQVLALEVHHNDAVAVDTGVSNAVFKIGRVLQVSDEVQLKVQWYGRMSELSGNEAAFQDPWALYLTDDSAAIDRRSIKHVVLVRAEPPVTHKHHPADIFSCQHHLPPGRPLHRRSLVPLHTPCACCIKCTSEILGREADLASFRQMGGLPSADLYAGGGGTMIGKKGWFASKLAVDLDETACAALEKNFARTTIVCHKIDRLLFAALHKDATGAHERIIDQRDVARAPEMARKVDAFPPRGSFALLSASPPCQGFSGKNRFKDAEDMRNEEVIVVIAEVERSRPDWVVIENVLGMAHGRSDGALLAEGSMSSFADFVNKMLIGLGYQVATAKLDAASYGSPSLRPRIFYMAARQGLPLPRFPVPTHTHRRFVNPGLTEEARGMFGRTAGSALLPGVSARDAISDLPVFDFAIPGLPTRAPTSGSASGFQGAIRIAAPPKTAYQAMKRADSELIDGHSVPPVSVRQMEEAAVQAGSAGFDLPKDDSGERTDKPYRARPDAPLKTLLTSPSGACVHWDQSRFFTVAERARAQGFPDDYILAGDLVAQNKQIGNAVNPDMASAIFRQIVLDAVLPVWLEMGRPAAEAFATRWRERYPV